MAKLLQMRKFRFLPLLPIAMLFGGCAKQPMVETVATHLAGETPLEEVLFVIPDSRERGPFEARIQEGA